jgi:hypothetical protein
MVKSDGGVFTAQAKSATTLIEERIYHQKKNSIFPKKKLKEANKFGGEKKKSDDIFSPFFDQTEACLQLLLDEPTRRNKVVQKGSGTKLHNKKSSISPFSDQKQIWRDILKWFGTATAIIAEYRFHKQLAEEIRDLIDARALKTVETSSRSHNTNQEKEPNSGGGGVLMATNQAAPKKLEKNMNTHSEGVLMAENQDSPKKVEKNKTTTHSEGVLKVAARLRRSKRAISARRAAINALVFLFFVGVVLMLASLGSFDTAVLKAAFVTLGVAGAGIHCMGCISSSASAEEGDVVSADTIRLRSLEFPSLIEAPAAGGENNNNDECPICLQDLRDSTADTVSGGRPVRPVVCEVGDFEYNANKKDLI